MKANVNQDGNILLVPENEAENFILRMYANSGVKMSGCTYSTQGNRTNNTVLLTMKNFKPVGATKNKNNRIPGCLWKGKLITQLTEEEMEEREEHFRFICKIEER